MKKIICVIIALFAVLCTFSTPKELPVKHSPAWEFSAHNFNPLWLADVQKFYPVPAVGSWVSPEGYIGDDCISWDFNMTDYWASHINWVHLRAKVTAIYQVCSGPGYTRYKAYLTYTPTGGTPKYIHWDGEFLPLY